MARVSADERRDLLVQAAIRVMVRDGVAAATTRAIVAEAGMQLGTFHYCFRSKQEFLETVIEAITGLTLDVAIEELRGETTLEGRLRAGLRSYWQHVLDHPAEHRVTYELTQYALSKPKLAPVAKRQYETYLAANTQVLEALAEASSVTWSVPMPVLARYVASLIDGLTLMYLNEGDGDTALAALELGAAHIVSLAEPA